MPTEQRRRRVRRMSAAVAFSTRRIAELFDILFYLLTDSVATGYIFGPGRGFPADLTNECFHANLGGGRRCGRLTDAALTVVRYVTAAKCRYHLTPCFIVSNDCRRYTAVS